MEDDVPRGAMFLVGAAFFFSLMSVQVKLAGDELPVEMLVLARGIVTLVLSFSILRLRGVSPWGHDRRRLVLRGALGTGGLVCFFTAITLLPLAEVTVIHYLNPVLTALLAARLLGERIPTRLWAAIVVSGAGILLVTRPVGLLTASEPLATWGIVAALGGALFSAGAYTTVRRLRLTDRADVIVFYFPLVAVPALFPFALRAWVWPTTRGWLLMLGIGVVTQIAQVLLTRGLALMPAGRGTAIGYVQIAFASAWGWGLFDEPMAPATILGATLIVGATIALTRRPSSPAASAR
ncbi:MAG: DMT family transporter [Myxococcota bacterium]